MAKIDELLQELCPDVVEYIKTGVACEIITDYVAAGSFAALRNKVTYLKGTGYAQLVRTSDLKQNFSNSEDFVYVSKEAFEFLWRVNLNTECIILPNVGINCGEVYYISPNLLNHKYNVLGPNAIKVESNQHNNRYLFFLFHTKYFQEEIRKITSSGGQPKFNKTKLKEILIPVPSISTQDKIVEVLDTFTDAISNLEEELALRGKQFEFYRESILSFENELVDWTPISELGQIIRGNGLQKKDFVQEGVGCIHYGQIYTKFGLSTSYTLSFVDAKLADKLTKVDPGNLVIACTSENVDDLCKSVVWLGNTTIVTGGHACVLKHKENAKYIGYCFTSNSFQSQKKKFAYGTKVLDIKKEKLGEIKIPVPSLERQQEIVEILDTFEAMIANIKEEISLRTKQYEYYREKLLSFGK